LPIPIFKFTIFFVLKTFKFRIKDSTQKTYLGEQSGKVNFVWNYCNQAHFDSIRNRSKWPTWVDLNNLTSGSSKELELPCETIQAVGEEFASKVKKARRRRLNWRSKKRNLGWIPFKARSIKVKDDNFRYNKRWFKFFKSRDFEGKIKCGSLNQDSKGNWFVNLVCETPEKSVAKTGKSIGVDLGLKTQLSCSDSSKFERENLTKKYEEKLAKAQRAKKKKLVTNLHTKIKNVRKDWSHKVTTKLIKENDKIFVGNVSSSKLIKAGLGKSINDSGWWTIKAMLEYKAISLGKDFHVTDEKFSTLTCSNCSARNGPNGLSGLIVRNWECLSCGSLHDRDVNAAINILNFGLGRETLALKGIPSP
jgi:transposase